MKYTLPPMPYAFDALEPYIDARTMELHYTKHHQTYIDNLNAALQDYPEVAAIPLSELLADLQMVPEAIRTAVQNNGGGHENHSQFWQWMTPTSSAMPKDQIASDIIKVFGSFEQFKQQMNDAAKKRFGSGWAWLVVNAQGTLEVSSTANQDTPLTAGACPLLGLDVWEHAYYLKYQNRRVDYMSAWWSVVNWDYVHQLYKHCK